MKYALIILLCVCFSCSVNTSVIGLYGKCEKGYWSCTQIEIKGDKTFEYFIFMDVGGATIVKGYWEQVSNDSIKLNTFKQPINPITTYKGNIVPTLSKKIKITLKDWELPLFGSYVTVNDQSRGVIADENGYVEIEANEVKTITYAYLTMRETIKIDNPNFNEIVITVKDLDLNVVPEYITNEVLIKKKNKIFFDDEYSLRKTNFKHKQW